MAEGMESHPHMPFPDCRKFSALTTQFCPCAVFTNITKKGAEERAIYTLNDAEELLIHGNVWILFEVKLQNPADQL